MAEAGSGWVGGDFEVSLKVHSGYMDAFDRPPRRGGPGVRVPYPARRVEKHLISCLRTRTHATGRKLSHGLRRTQLCARGEAGSRHGCPSGRYRAEGGHCGAADSHRRAHNHCGACVFPCTAPLRGMWNSGVVWGGTAGDEAPPGPHSHPGGCPELLVGPQGAWGGEAVRGWCTPPWCGTCTHTQLHAHMYLQNLT